MKTQDILNLTLEEKNALTEKDLRLAVNTLAGLANKRYDRLEKTKRYTPAYRAAESSGGRFSTKKKNRNELQKELKRVSAFLRAKTSTVTGAKQYEKDFEKRVGQKLDEKQRETLWNVFNRIAEIEPQQVSEYGSNQLLQDIASNVVQSNKSVDELLQDVENRLNLAYEEREREFLSNGGFFEEEFENF